MSNTEMYNHLTSSHKYGKLPTKAIDMDQNFHTNSILTKPAEGEKTIMIVPSNLCNTQPEVNVQPKLELSSEKDTCVKEDRTINILENFKLKCDTIFLKIFPDYHPLSVEQQVFFVKLTEGIFGYNEQIRNEMLRILSTDCNVIELVPYLCTFVKETIQCNIVFSDLTLLIYSVRMTKSLLANQHVNLKEYLHEIIPAILSCTLAKKISKYHYDNHWTLRDFSAYVTGMICNLYGNGVNNIFQRVIMVYKKAIVDCTKPMTSLYGAIKGLGSLGEETIKSHIIPYIPHIGRRLFTLNEKKSLYADENKQQAIEAKHVRDAVLNTVSPILLKIRNTNDGGVKYINEFGYLGHAIYMQVKHLEKAELEKMQNQVTHNTCFNQYNNCMRSQNFSYMPRSVSNFGIQYVSGSDTITLYGGNDFNTYNPGASNINQR